VIEASQRHARGARKIAHRSTFVSFFAEHFGGVIQYLAEPTMETGVG
jgi:hypothetical protein